MTRAPRRILLVSHDDPRDPVTWSGVPYSVFRALEKQVDRIDVVAGVPVVRSAFHVGVQHLLGERRYPLWMTKPALVAFGRALERAVDDLAPDAIISVSSQYLVHCRSDVFDRVPTVMFSDAPWELWQEAYRGFAKRRVLTGLYGRWEAEVVRRITATVYASEWATEWFVARHRVPRQKLHVAPFGATMTQRSPLPPRRASEGVLRLLFVGVHWKRKGGSFAVEVTRALRALGRDARLDVVGCSPELDEADGRFTEVHGVLPLDSPTHRERLEQLFGEAHLLLVPTRAECFGIVFAEAGAFGIPAVAGDVHAVPSVVEDGVNGLLVGERDDPESVARRIHDLVADEDRYGRMATTARARYEARFTWDAFARHLLDALDRGGPRSP
jgi:glycosyltransferase involved in cell wall biosynthesis